MERRLHSGVIVEVPEAETVVGSYRMRLDANARLGVPAHITVLFPFAEPDDITAEMLGRLHDIAAAVPAFEFRLPRTNWFGEDVLWLAPDPDDVFRRLTSEVAAAFPSYPPYGGEFSAVVPHLTIAERGSVDAMRAAERAVQRELPICSHAQSLTLMIERDSGTWDRVATFALTSR